MERTKRAMRSLVTTLLVILIWFASFRGEAQTGFPIAHYYDTNAVPGQGGDLYLFQRGTNYFAVANSNLFSGFSNSVIITTITNNTFVNTNVFISTSNSFFNISYVTNLTSITNINNTLINTNVLIVTSNSFFNNSYITNITYDVAKGGRLTITNNAFINIETNNTFVNTNLFIVTSNAFFNTTYVTNLTVNIQTNNTFVVTNTFISTSNSFITTITNVTFVSSNAFITNITSINNFLTNIYTTNITIVQPGGLTNLNATPNTVAFWDSNDGITSVPNAVGIFTNNGAGGVGFTTTISLTEIDAQNVYMTNAFTFITNSTVLATDGNGKIINGFPLAGTNVLLTPGGNIVFTTNSSGNITIAASGVLSSQIYASNVISGGVLSTNTLSATAGANGWFLGQSNAAVVWTLNGGSISNLNGANLQSGTVVNSALVNLNLVAWTNWNGSMPTNNGGGSALVFGGPNSTATASILYSTNITANTTLAPFDISHTPNTASGIKLRGSCSGGTDRTLTFPNGCTGAGLGTPPVITITNAKAAWFDVIYDPMTPSTNVFWSPVF